MVTSTIDLLDDPTPVLVLCFLQCESQLAEVERQINPLLSDDPMVSRQALYFFYLFFTEITCSCYVGVMNSEGDCSEPQ